MCILFNELTAWRYIVAHQHGECALCLGRIVNRNLPQTAFLRIHGGVPELHLGHFAETLVALDHIAFVSTFSERKGGFLSLLLCPAVYLFLALLDKVERRSCEIDVAVLYEVGHIAEEECQYEAGDMRAIDIGIGHDDHLVVAQLAEIHMLLAGRVLLRDWYSKRRID